MSYEFLCPSCGHGFPEGTSFAKCPECQVPLLRAMPRADLRNLPEDLDLPAVLRDALSQPETGDVDGAIKGALARACPDAAEGLQTLLTPLLESMQTQLGITRREAVQQLADSKVEIKADPDGTPKIKFLAPIVRREMHIEGLEKLSAEERRQVEQQVEEFLQSGKPLSAAQVVLQKATIKTTVKPGCTIHVLLAILALLSGLAFFG